MKSRTALTNLSLWSRQLSLAVSLLGTVPTLAQPAPGIVQGLQNQMNFSLPAIPMEATGPKKISVSQMSASETQAPKTWFNNFVVNSDLSLGLVYKYKFSFNFNIQDGKSVTPVPDGWYKITVATFLKDEPNARNPERVPLHETLEDRFVTVSPPMVVPVHNGQAVVDPLPLRFTNPTATTVINTIYVEFTPVECYAEPCVKTDDNGVIDTSQSHLRDVNGYAKCLVTAPWLPSDRSVKGDCAPDHALDADSRRLEKEGLTRFANRVMVDRIQKASAQAPTVITARDYAAKNRLAYIDLSNPSLVRFGQMWMKNDIRVFIQGLLSGPNAEANRRNERLCQVRPDSEKCQAYRTFGDPVFEAKPIRLPPSATGFDSALCDMIFHANRSHVPLSYKNPGCAMPDNASLPNSLPIYVRRNLHVGRVNTRQILPYHYNQPFKNVLTTNLSSGRSHDESVGFSITEKLGAMLGLAWTSAAVLDPSGMVLKAKAVLDYFDSSRTINFSNSRSRGENDGYSVQTYLDITPTLVDIDATQVQPCVEIKTDASNDVVQHPNATLGYYICGPALAQAKVQEFYANAYTHVASTSTATAFARSTQAVNMSLRGDRDASLFFRMVRGALGPDPGRVEAYLGNVSWPEWFTQDATRYFANTKPAETNVISVPVIVNDNSNDPSLTGKLIGFTKKVIGTYHEKFDF